MITGVLVGVCEGVAVVVDVFVGSGVFVIVGVSVGAVVAVAVAVGELFGVAVRVAVPVAVGVVVIVAVSVGVAVWVPVAVGDGVGVMEGVTPGANVDGWNWVGVAGKVGVAAPGVSVVKIGKVGITVKVTGTPATVDKRVGVTTTSGRVGTAPGATVYAIIPRQ